ncbi:LysM peptidoglycan-binding domain-containing M23 family metallopeptidase [Rhodoplanes sp. Z2-YC6860]|uniref:LysM peptidoglycan-binding domain-containing M23 family metallopeptidase n=1 Tax=Rhodoplanes sp. Z2-YC6860 TaxID=674703 RepID=UPI001F3D642D|nr:LysM peptidoglycan-binding domain-containing M23 family metallopeptidase [Rhodoplanes sp. Z2-YC6860]
MPQAQPQRHSVVQGAALPPPNAPYASAPNTMAPQTRPAMTSQAGGSPGMASYHPGGTSAEMAPPPPARAAAQSTPRSGWNWEGGTAITVQQGDTIDGIVRRYGVPASAIAQANNLPNGSALRPGQRLVIPKYESTGSTTMASAGPKPAMPIGIPPSNAPAVGGQHVHIIAPGETLMKLSRQYNKPLVEIARANHIPASTMVKVGDRIIIPGVRGAPPQHLAARQTVPQPAPVATIPAKPAPSFAQPQIAQPKIAQPKVAAPVPQRVATVPAAPVAQSTANVVTPAAENPEPPKARDATAGLPSFRWPVNGRVIQAFGPKPSGQQNDGLNVSVPEGTPIKAAEDGVVAYAGNELKTYGNLVLIRHANGYVTAYAHASEILVKRDDTVKRGQIIAKAGQTGSVNAPQVHFEIRKGSTPVDPAPFLNKGGAG